MKKIVGGWEVDVGKVGEMIGKEKGTEKEGSGWDRGGRAGGTGEKGSVPVARCRFRPCSLFLLCLLLLSERAAFLLVRRCSVRWGLRLVQLWLLCGGAVRRPRRWLR